MQCLKYTSRNIFFKHMSFLTFLESQFTCGIKSSTVENLSVQDGRCPGRPKSAIPPENLSAVLKCITEDSRYTLKGLALSAGSA